MKKHRVTFLPDNVEVMVESGTRLMMAAAEAGVEFEGPCGGRGICGKCRMHILEGEKTGWVLACQKEITSDLLVEVPEQEIYLSRETDLTKGDLAIEIDSGIEKVYLELTKPSLKNQAADAARFLQALDRPAHLSLKALQALPHVLREKEHQVTAILAGDLVISIEAGDTRDNPLYGLAIDIGTTTVVANLVDLTTGAIKRTASGGNNQNIFGADVISRIQYASKGQKELDQIRTRVVQVINRLIEELAREVNIKEQEIYQVCIVCNTTMHHLFLGLDPRYLAPAPFIPVATSLTKIEGREVGLNTHPYAPIYLLPNVAGFVGGDTVGVILSTGIYDTDKRILAVDVGTNGEIALALPGKLFTCSTAAGPAFEGAQIKKGMRAQGGAIERVKIEEDRISIQVIGDTKAKGICGSGLIDVVSEMARWKIVEPSGRFAPEDRREHLTPFLKSRIIGQGGDARFVIATPEETGGEEVYLTQKDVREVQLAKGAIRGGIQLLLNDAGLTPADLDEVLLAGAFGNYIDREAALGMGLLPEVEVDKIKAVGNAAGTGARMALINKELRELSEKIAKEAAHLELSSREDFQAAFLKHLNF